MWRDILKRRYARFIIIVFISISFGLSLLLTAARAEARPLLRVGIHQFGSDITEDSSGNFHGMETDFMQALGSYAGREVIFVPGTWEECQQRLEAGDIDVLAGVIKTPKRAETMLFSRLMMGRASDEANFHGELMPYRVNQLHFAVRRDNPELMRELDLAADQLIANRPYFVSHLYQIYYGQRGASELRLTEKEQRFLKRHPVISAVVVAREAPFAYVDEHGELQGTMRKLVDRLEHHLNRGLAAAIVLGTFLLICLGLVLLVSSTFIPTFTRFVTDFPQITEKLQQMPLIQDNAYLTDEFEQFWLELKAASVDALKSSLTVLLSIFSKFIDMVIILFVTFYLLKDGDDIKVYLASLFPTRDYSRVLALFNRILSALRTYICSQLVICCLTATVVFLYYTARSLPYASVFAMVSGISEFVPVLGPTVASIFGILLTATVDPWIAIQTAGFYLILTQVNHNAVYPTLIGKSLNLHPVAIILGIILGGEVLGAAGMFLAVPFIVICKLVIEDIYKDRMETIKKLRTSRWLSKEKHEEK